MKHFIIAISFSTLVLGQEKDKDLEAFRQVEQEVKNNLTEEIVKINDTFFMIKPIGGVAGNVGVFIAEEGLVLVDDQWEIIEYRERAYIVFKFKYSPTEDCYSPIVVLMEKTTNVNLIFQQ